ncbi:hypothetical protein [Streptococcus ruminantium]|uniref:Uncharacterized protein n=1 Tax=Streptococcus ruminantium TaxID=1917441 RepID=A0A2Z5TNK3_9STRE|nr:hypothetical protein [Streptococcus ruminantium]BBA92064.1 hypothetical protein SR187_2275 [Streptococcus ruminantium]
MSNIVKQWQNTVAIIDTSSAIKNLLEQKQIGKLKKEGYFIYNQENIWLFEEEFIDEITHSLQQIFDKLSCKDYTQIEYFDYETNSFINFYNGADSEIYLKIVRSNIIDGIEFKKLNISLALLSKDGYEAKSERVKHLIDIYILLLLSSKTRRRQDKLEFSFEGEQEVFLFESKFGDKNLENGLLEIYDWIINSQEYREAYKVKLQIVRTLIAKQKQLKEFRLLKSQSESIFNRIISGKTDKYFELQSSLKDDFIKISTEVKNYNSSLNTKLFGWLTAFSLIIFDFIKESGGPGLFHRIIFSNSEKTQLLLLLLLGALIIIMTMFNLDIKTIRKQYLSLKDFYVNQMLVSEDEFNKFINKPMYRNSYNLLLALLLFALGIRFLITLK